MLNIGKSARTLVTYAPIVEYLPVVGVLALMTALTAYNLGLKSVWLDEAASITYAGQTWRGLLDFWWNSEANQGLYYAALKVWTGVFGTSEVAVRLLSVIPAVGTVWATWRLGTVLFDSRTAILAALLLALNGSFLAYAQEARAYSMMTFFALLATLCFVRAAESPTLGRWLLYTATTVVGVYLHVFVALVPVAHLAALLLVRRREVPWRHLTISAVLGLIMVAPILAFMMRPDMGYGTWIEYRGLRGLLSMFYFLSGQNYVLLAGYFVLSSIAALGLGWAYYRQGGIRRLWPLALVVSLLLVPILVAFLASTVKPVFVNRYLLYCLPALTLLVALGLTHARPAILSLGLLAIILTGSVLSLYGYHESEKSDWRRATEYLATVTSPHDAVLFYAGYSRLGYDYYSSRLPAKPSPRIVFPVEGVHDPDGPPPDGLVAALPAQHAQTWLVLHHDQLGQPGASEKIHGILAEGYPQVEERLFTGIRIVRYRRE
jgi:mannosyltransferase